MIVKQKNVFIYIYIKGFDRFIMRLHHWGICIEAFDISKEVYDEANSNDLLKILTPREAFKLLKVTPPPPPST